MLDLTATCSTRSARYILNSTVDFGANLSLCTDAAVSRRQTPSPYCTAPLLATTPRPPLRPVRAQSARRWWRYLLTLHAPSPLDAGTGWRYASLLLACSITSVHPITHVTSRTKLFSCFVSLYYVAIIIDQV
jgi:hypothetical protein